MMHNQEILKNNAEDLDMIGALFMLKDHGIAKVHGLLKKDDDSMVISHQAQVFCSSRLDFINSSDPYLKDILPTNNYIKLKTFIGKIFSNKIRKHMINEKCTMPRKFTCTYVFDCSGVYFLTWESGGNGIPYQSIGNLVKEFIQ